MGVVVKDQPTISVVVPAQFVADHIVNDANRVGDERDLYPLRLGDVDLGMWRIMSVTHGRPPGEHLPSCIVVLQPVWP